MTPPNGTHRSAQAGAAPRAATLVDQGLSSVSNILAVLLVAHVLSAADFGRFALSFTILTLALGLSRSYFGTRVSLAADREAARGLTGSLLGSILIVAPLAFLAVLALSVLAGGRESIGIFFIVALATPIVCLQDIVRFGAAASGRPSAALLSDGLWVVVMAVPFVFGLTLTSKSALALWGAAAFAALVVALVVFGERPRLRSGYHELRRWHAVSASITFGTVVASLAFLWILVVVSRVIGPTAAGSLRGAATSMGPVNVLLAFVTLGLTPTLVRRPRDRDIAYCVRTAFIIAGVMMLWGIVLLTVPQSLGTAAFGQSWTGIRQVLPWTVVEYIAACVAVAATLGLQVRHRSGHLMLQKGSAALVVVVVGTTFAVVFRETWTVAVSLMIAALTSAILGWARLVRSPSVPAHLTPSDLGEPVTVELGAGLPGPVRPVVGYTAGVFDLFHVGHLNLLHAARSRCDRLVVGVTTDELAISAKGTSPLVSFAERAELVENVVYVDEVVAQTSLDKVDAWRSRGFDVVFVGDNLRGTTTWTDLETRLGAVGVPVVYLPYTVTTSDALLARMKDDQVGGLT